MMRGSDVAMLIGTPVAILFIAAVGVLSAFSILSSREPDQPPERLFKIQECEVWGFTYRGSPQTVAVCPTFQPHYPRSGK